MHLEQDLSPLRDEIDTPCWQFAVASSILGWVLDAFDFFVVVFLLDALAGNFHVQKEAIVWTISITLALRPVGALPFGALADRYGRKKPLMACVLYFSIVTILSGFAPNYIFLAVMRALYGIGMGDYWGIGASFAMENAPRKRRGVLSGMMQGGYPFGYLLAAVGMLTIMPQFGWRAMFVVGSSLAAVIVSSPICRPNPRHGSSIGWVRSEVSFGPCSSIWAAFPIFFW
jgi:MFS transporter, SHS family, lactate transporter